MNTIYCFNSLSERNMYLAGGKGASLAHMKQMNLPIPEGFILLFTAFESGHLTASANKELVAHLSGFENNYTFAVRSSALSEDNIKASFAGEFDTVLDVPKDRVKSAIETVIASAKSDRVKIYSEIHGIKKEHKMAVVVQAFVKPELAGVLFTSDPLTGSHTEMIGNYVHGVGELLVSGESNAKKFSLSQPKYIYTGDEEFRQYAKKLYILANKIEKAYGCPQDIEWAISKEKLYILQSRPITTLSTINYDTYEVNESLDGDFIWTSNNVGEAIPDVMTPMTWSIVRELDLGCQKINGYYLWSDNICGRVYSNVSMVLSALTMLGISVKLGKRLMGDVFGTIDEKINIPIYPNKSFNFLVDMIKRGKKNAKRITDARKQKVYYLEHTPIWCDEMTKKINKTKNNDEFLKLWQDEIRPYVSKLFAIWLGGASNLSLFTLRKKLVELVGEEDANTLCSNFSGKNVLTSMEPLLGIDKVINGKMTREEYIKASGHRSPHEFEVSYPYPIENKSYIEKLINDYKKSGIDVKTLIKNQQEKN